MPHNQPDFLPVTLKEAENLGIDRFDIILLSGDAYVDHPSFGTALIGRVLWDAGYTVGIIPQPDIRDPASFWTLGEPSLFFGVSAGNVDSMVANYTPAGRKRSQDAYTPGGIPGRRPDRATLVYADMVHREFPRTPVILGGLEASLRRFAHYDAWDNRVRQSLLADAPADMIMFGMAERQVTRIAADLAEGKMVREIRSVPGTVWKMAPKNWEKKEIGDFVELPSCKEVSSDPVAYARAFLLHSAEQDPFRGKKVVQPHNKTVVIQNPPAEPLTTEELDHLYSLPFSRKEHPSCRGSVPALKTVQFSLTSHRGCFGGCSFCSITHHQGRIIQSRSADSIRKEAKFLTTLPGFAGTISDVGGPTANMYGASCSRWSREGTCQERDCLSCSSRLDGHESSLQILRMLRDIPGVKRVFISSGIRYDLIPDDSCYLEELCSYHISGHLKVAPEHVSERVLRYMGKPSSEVFTRFLEKFEKIQAGKKKRQYLVPYLISGHPGCTLEDMATLAVFLQDHHLAVEQVQDFTPTPMTLSTCMYHTGIDPLTGSAVHVPRGREKVLQRALLGYRDPYQAALVREALHTTDRDDLIGYHKSCLVPPLRQGEIPAQKIPPGDRFCVPLQGSRETGRRMRKKRKAQEKA